MGQWMSGGMMMIGDMFNDNLKWRVGSLLSELSQHREPQPAMAPPQGNWGFVAVRQLVAVRLGSPASSGSQNDMAYAWFPASRRLLLKLSGDVFAFDTGDLSIYGVQQQQGSGMELDRAEHLQRADEPARPQSRLKSSGGAPAPPAEAAVVGRHGRVFDQLEADALARASTASKSRMPRLGSSAPFRARVKGGVARAGEAAGVVKGP